MSRARRSTALLLGLALIGLGALAGIGCGDDNNTEVTLPTISVQDDAQTVPDQTTTTESTPTESQNGGTGPGTGTYDPKQPDSAANDKPPQPGSPEEQFENACKQNPAACG